MEVIIGKIIKMDFGKKHKSSLADNNCNLSSYEYIATIVNETAENVRKLDEQLKQWQYEERYRK